MWGGDVRFSDKSLCRADTDLVEHLTKTVTAVAIIDEEKMIGAPEELGVKDCVEQLKCFPQLQVLTLANGEIDDDMLGNVGQLSQLQELSLARCKITDHGLDRLKGLNQLGELYLRRTQVTDAGVKKLQQALPNCKIK